jgi:hypothetical protein
LFHDDGYAGGRSEVLLIDGTRIGDVKNFKIYMRPEIEGCGKPDCRQCRNSKEGFARIDGWNKAREESKKMTSGLAQTLTDNSLRTITTQIDGYFDGQIKAKEQVITSNRERARQLRAEIEKLNDNNVTLNSEIKDLKTARDTVAKAVKSALPKERGEFFYFPSRSGESGGHYIERFKDGTMTDTCQAGQFGRACWARTSLSNMAEHTRSLYRSGYTASEFDVRAKEASATALRNR